MCSRNINDIQTGCVQRVLLMAIVKMLIKGRINRSDRTDWVTHAFAEVMQTHVPLIKH